ncbi:MAG: YheT family hydrolase [Steroidobacteraceae bacterium]
MASASTLDRFMPPSWLRGGHRQSVLSSLPPRRGRVLARSADLRAAAAAEVIDCGEGVSLLAQRSRVPAADPSAADPPLLVLLHGWEGSADSLYVLSLGAAAFRAGWDVLRLNFRDHGPSHHLNRGIFHSCRLDEVVGALLAVREASGTRRMALAGFSLGGNFALRGGAHPRAREVGLSRILAVCPVLDPAVTLRCLEEGPAIYRHYFLRKWRRSLRAKQQAWPGDYDFRDLLGARSLTAMTATMVEAYTDFASLEAYLAGYALTGARLAGLQVESLLLTSSDDPLIPDAQLPAVSRTDGLEICLTRFGGHCGFLKDLSGPSWLDGVALNWLLAPPPA